MDNDLTGLEEAVGHYESGGNYTIGYGGTDLSDAPLNEYGFPQWSGKEGPYGVTHAAGKYQFEPAEWERYAKPLGITDFSPASQDAVFQAAHANEGMAPWKSNKLLMTALQGTGFGTGLGSGSKANIEPQGQLNALLDPETMPSGSASKEQMPPIQVMMPPNPMSNPLVLFSLIKGMMSGQTITPVEYDPWKIAGEMNPFERRG